MNDICTMSKGCIQTQYIITMWEDIGVHDWTELGPTNYNHPYIRLMAPHNSCVYDRSTLSPPIASKTKDIEMGTKETNHGWTKSESPYNFIQYDLHGFNLLRWAYNGVAKMKNVGYLPER